MAPNTAALFGYDWRNREVAMSPSRLWLLPLLLLSVPALADPVALGTAVLNPRATSTIVPISACTKADHVGIPRVGWEVLVGVASVDRLVVTFGNGTTQRIDVGRRLEPGIRTDGNAFQGGCQCVKQVEVFGATDVKTTLKIWGDSSTCG